jgi:hypothetical protein
VALISVAWGAGLLFPVEPPPSDPGVASLGSHFEDSVAAVDGIAVGTKGALRRDRDTFFWSMFVDKFGSNPNTPYVVSAPVTLVLLWN